MYLRSSGSSITKGLRRVVIWLFKHFNKSNIMLGFGYRFLVLNLELKASLPLFVPQTLLSEATQNVVGKMKSLLLSMNGR